MAKKEFKKKGPRAPSVQAKPEKAEDENFRGVIRIAGKDVDGHMLLYRGLLRVRGVGSNLAYAMERVIRNELKLPLQMRCGDLTDEQIDKIDEMLRMPSQHGIPEFSLNRSKSAETGRAQHVLMNDLVFAVRTDVQKEKDMRSWRGWRHSLGQKVRGQHTRTTGRSGMTVGVLRKSIKEQKAAAAAGGEEKKEKK
ncbi:30S ribosomal protein S13 [Candidatus Micrarchaeota archaeon]|nr:30S ribosomal protein S13 [Candidatus Micrarchaeota archaeon]